MLTVLLQIFLYLLDKHFGRSHKCHKIFNGNNVKISYSCIDNLKNIISSHKKEIANFYNEINGKTCNHPFDNKC